MITFKMFGAVALLGAVAFSTQSKAASIDTPSGGCAVFHGFYDIDKNGNNSTGVFYAKGFRAGDVIRFKLNSAGGGAAIVPEIYDATARDMVAGGSGRWTKGPKTLTYKVTAATAGHVLDASGYDYSVHGAGHLRGSLTCSGK